MNTKGANIIPAGFDSPDFQSLVEIPASTTNTQKINLSAPSAANGFRNAPLPNAFAILPKISDSNSGLDAAIQKILNFAKQNPGALPSALDEPFDAFADAITKQLEERMVNGLTLNPAQKVGLRSAK